MCTGRSLFQLSIYKFIFMSQVMKRDEESSLMQLKEEFRNYESLRCHHDAQIVEISLEFGLRILPEQWSCLLYGDASHKPHMQSIVDKVPCDISETLQILSYWSQRQTFIGTFMCYLGNLIM